MKKIGIAAALVVSAVIIYFMAAPAPKGEAPSDPEPAAALTVPSLDGKPTSLADFKGKVVLVDFWATWCDPCKEEIPELAKMYAKLSPKGFVVWGISMDEEGAKAVKKFMAKQPIPYPLALNGGERAPKGWTVPGLPTAYLIGRDGKILKRWFGEKEMPELEKDVDAALGQ